MLRLLLSNEHIYLKKYKLSKATNILLPYKTKGFSLSIGPIPVEHKAKMLINSNIDSEAIAIIYNSIGTRIKKQNLYLKEGINNYPINDIDDLTRGVFFVEIVTVNGTKRVLSKFYRSK